jgi:hypothetical protein
MIEFMKKTKEIYYQGRKKLFFNSRDYNRLRKPSWMNPLSDNRFEATYREQGILIKKGKIVIAHIVQANTQLFKAGQFDCPASMVFSEDTYFEENPNKLKDIAHRLFEIKGISSDDEDIQRFSDILADEIVTLFNAKIPEKITFGKKVYFTSFMVHRGHLPNGYIDFDCFPALVCPEKTEAAIILPSKYWFTETIKQKKTLKIMKDKKLMELLYDNPEKYVEVIQEHIEFAKEKSKTSRFNKDRWLGRIKIYSFQKTTALIYCNRHEEARVLLEELLSNINISKAQENGSTFYIIVLGNLIATFIESERFEEAKENIVLMEKAMSNRKEEANDQPLYKALQLKKIELDILNGDIERGEHNLKTLLEAENEKTLQSNLFLYYGIYYYKRGEKYKSLEYFNKSAALANFPNFIKRIQFYKTMLMDENELYKDDVVQVENLEE